ncbi:hypothetical protein [Cupriavidus oxalaticus]|uniref:hypothetical protein n=1 Tax=Cupriavidus oxalaticus TaxID=96344 RepID=UPI00124776F7|nr:hypothetical protein [Cupriavidus oxalaticus]
MTTNPNPEHVDTLLRQGEAWIAGAADLDGWTPQRRGDALAALQACPLPELPVHVETLRLAFADIRERHGVKPQHVRMARPPPDGKSPPYEHRVRGLARFLSHKPGENPMSTLPAQSALSLSPASNDLEPDLFPPQDEHVTTELREREQRIEHALRGAYVEVGLELRTIRNGRLYRANFGTFEDYCATRWEWTRERCRQLIESATLAETLANKFAIAMPSRERHVAALLCLPSDNDKAKVWRTVLDAHPDGRITAKDVVAAVQAHLGIACEPNTPAAPPPEPAPPVPTAKPASPSVPPVPVSGKGRSRSPLAMRTDRAHVTDVEPAATAKAARKSSTPATSVWSTNATPAQRASAADAIVGAINLLASAKLNPAELRDCLHKHRDALHRAGAFLAGIVESIENR